MEQVILSDTEKKQEQKPGTTPACTETNPDTHLSKAEEGGIKKHSLSKVLCFLT